MKKALWTGCCSPNPQLAQKGIRMPVGLGGGREASGWSFTYSNIKLQTNYPKMGRAARLSMQVICCPLAMPVHVIISSVHAASYRLAKRNEPFKFA